MPTSSITEPIRINNPKLLEEYVAHMEESAKHFYDKKRPHSNVCTDTKRMDAFMKKALAKEEVTLETKNNSLKECVVNISWDNDARVWTATSEDVLGLALESCSFDALIEKLRHAVPDLCEMNDKKYERYDISYVCQRRDTLTR